MPPETPSQLDDEPITCPNCGSEDVVNEGPAEGYWCRSCGASESDE